MLVSAILIYAGYKRWHWSVILAGLVIQTIVALVQTYRWTNFISVLNGGRGIESLGVTQSQLALALLQGIAIDAAICLGCYATGYGLHKLRTRTRTAT